MARRDLRPPPCVCVSDHPDADVIGAFSFTRLGLDRFPKVDFPTILVTTRLPGASPEQVETEITDKIEEAVNTISGIDELRSTSAEGVSVVIVAFVLDKNVDVAAQEVRDKINRAIPLLPRNVEQPTVEKFDPDSAPVLSVAVSAKKPIRDITELADKVLRRRLESVNGVGQVLVSGGRQRQVNIWLDATRLRAYNLTVTDVSRALQAQNLEVPGGRLEQGPRTVTLRTLGRVQTVEAFNGIIVRERDGHAITVGDVARVEDGMAEAETLANLNGTPTVLLTIRRQSGTNTVEVVKAVEERLEELRAGLAPGLRAARRARPVDVHRGLYQERRRTPDTRLIARGSRRAPLPLEPAIDGDCRHRNPHIHHRDVRAHVVHAVHAELHDHAGAHALGGHRHRRRDRRAREHLPLHRGEGPVALRRLRWKRPGRLAWRCSRRRFRSPRSSCRSDSWAGSWVVS